MSTARTLAALAVLTTAPCGCRTPRDRVEVPAVVVNPTPRSRAALAAAVRAALGGAPVTLADDALTTAPVLQVEPVVRRDAAGLPLDGRERRRPERFGLVKRGPACILVHEPDGARSALADTECAPAAGRAAAVTPPG